MKGLLITGTDTGVGKTTVACGLARLMRRRGLDVGVMKPVATGAEENEGRLRSRDALYLAEAAGVADPPEDINPIVLSAPLAPVAAAAKGNTKIDLSRIDAAFARLCEAHERILVEGIGGLLVPLVRGFSVANLAARHDLPMLIVARTTLGTVNHTLLTLDAAQARGLSIAGVVFNRLQAGPPGEDELTGPDEIRAESDANVLGQLPFLPMADSPDFDVLADACAKHLRLDTIL